MFFLSFIWMCNIINGICLNLEDVMIKDSADYEVNIVIDENELEMVDKKQLVGFERDISNENFEEFNEIAHKEYTKPNIWANTKNIPTQKYTINRLRIARPKLTSHAISKRELSKDEEIEYNYDQLVIEYYDEAVNDTKSIVAYHINKSDIISVGVKSINIINSLKRIVHLDAHDNCNEKDTTGIGIRTIKCLWDDYKSHRKSLNIVKSSLWRIIKIWLLFYLLVATPMWCTKGWCCCCLFCKCFKPRRTIAEAKKYAILNPPGVFRVKNGDVKYDPTESEKETYEEFEHFLRTL